MKHLSSILEIIINKHYLLAYILSLRTISQIFLAQTVLNYLHQLMVVAMWTMKLHLCVNQLLNTGLVSFLGF